MSFIAELRRRRVFRVAGAYLVAAWVVLQVAATLVPALHLPGWAVTLVAVLLIAGFPIALVLGWVFDFTPGGVERTDASPTFRFPVRAAVAGTLIVMTGVVGFLVVKRRLNAAGIDSNAIVVLPFRVSGDAKLAAMGEGMVDLMAPKLTGVGGPRAVDSRTTLSAWRRTTDSGAQDITPKDAIKLARKLKASQVILGEVVAAPGAIVLNARVYSTIDGVAGEPAEVKTTQDSLLNAIDLLVAELLSTQAGERDRLSALLTSSLPAVQAYLDGNRLYRRGRYEEAAKHFGTATDIDSTFALAALGEWQSLGWVNYGPRYERAVRLSFDFRDKLPPRERALLVGRLGEAYPKPMPYTKSLPGWQQLTAQYPDSPEMWYEMGDHFLHYGQTAGMEDYEDRALDAWSRAIALDSSYAAPWEHQLEIHAGRGDTARLRAAYDKLVELKGEAQRGPNTWLYAAVARDDTLRTRLLQDMEGWGALEVLVAASGVFKAAASPVGLDTLVEHAVRTAFSDAARNAARNFAAGYELNRGRPSRARAHLDAAAGLPGDKEKKLAPYITNSILYPELGTDRALEARRQLANSKSAEIACTIGVWDALNKNATSVRRMLELMRDSIAANPDAPDSYTYCVLVMQAADAVMQRQPRARAELERVDSMIVDGPMMDWDAANFTAVVVSRLYAQMGDFEKARQAALRGRATTWGMGAQTLEHARMAARTGRSAEAVRSYRIYLAMRDNPEPGPAKETTDKARAELAALTARQ